MTAREQYNKGKQFEKNRNYESAIDAYKKAVELDPQHTLSWLGIGYCSKIMGEYEKAIEAYKKVLETC